MLYDRAQLHTHSHPYGQFRHADQPTTHLWTGEETGVPGGKPQGTGITCKLHTHGRDRSKEVLSVETLVGFYFSSCIVAY